MEAHAIGGMLLILQGSLGNRCTLHTHTREQVIRTVAALLIDERGSVRTSECRRMLR